MGGPCFLLVGDDSAPATGAVDAARLKFAFDSAGRPTGAGGRRRVRGPPATDNFAVHPFTFDGTLWQSVEQCYQAHKFPDANMREAIRLMVPQPGETDHTHGLRVWQAGARGKLREDWDAVKIEIMLRACRSKLAAHEDLREQLLSTGDVPIIGGPSTDWVGASGHHGWSTWNGKIQELLREELRQDATGAAPSEKLHELTAAFADYMRAEGGAKHPLPQGSEESSLAAVPVASKLFLPPPPPKGSEDDAGLS